MAKQKFTLGRGLDALISTEALRTSGSSSIGEIEIGKIFANPNQPRRDFNEEALQELAQSAPSDEPTYHSYHRVIDDIR